MSKRKTVSKRNNFKSMAKLSRRRRESHPVKSPEKKKEKKLHIHRNDGKKSKAALREVKAMVEEQESPSPKQEEDHSKPTKMKRKLNLGRPSSTRTTPSSKLLSA